MPEKCPHDRIECRWDGEQLSAEADGSLLLKVQVRCAHCLVPFAFVGLPPTNQMVVRPTMGAYGHEARLPIVAAATNPSWEEIDRVIDEAIAAPPVVVPEIKN